MMDDSTKSDIVTFRENVANDSISQDVTGENMSNTSHSMIESDDNFGHDNTEDGNEVISMIQRQMGEISNELQNNLRSLREQVQHSLSDFQSQLTTIHKTIDGNNNNKQTHYSDLNFNRSNHGVISPDTHAEGLGRGRRNSTPENNAHVHFSDHSPGSNAQLVNHRPIGYSQIDQHNIPQSANYYQNTSHGKMRPQTYDGSDDLDEYLTQFCIISDLNGWTYETKSLYLASSLVGEARALLNDLDQRQRRDYCSLVEALNNRFGSINRAEIYRSKLQSRVLNKNETIPELAQSIKKLTRKAYPSASYDVVDLLALDYFIDSLPDTEIRLRLREVGPKNINEAERIAVRLEAHRIADKNRGRHNVRSIESSTNMDDSHQKLDGLVKQLSELVKEVKQIRYEKNRQVPTYTNNQQTNGRYQNQTTPRSNGNQRYQNNNQNRNSQRNHYEGNRPSNRHYQGNDQRLSQGTATQSNQRGPTQIH